MVINPIEHHLAIMPTSLSMSSTDNISGQELCPMRNEQNIRDARVVKQCGPMVVIPRIAKTWF